METPEFEIKGTRAGFGSPEYAEVMDFVHDEAQHLDEGELLAWLDLLADDLSYLMPVRTTTLRGQKTGLSPTGYYDETKTSLAMRVKRYLDSPSAWAEDPASRTRRFITNVRVWLDENGDRIVCSNYLILRSRLDQPDFEIVSAERRDLLRHEEGRLKLVRRHVYCDQTSMASQNLAFFV